jgi:HK97 gp10 family phage protein
LSYKSRLPQIAAELGARMDALTRTTAEIVEQRAKDRVPVATGKLKNAIHVEREGVGEHMVIAGDTEVFYGHIVEHGGSNTPAQPFMTPAVEQTRAELRAIGARALKGL